MGSKTSPRVTVQDRKKIFNTECISVFVVLHGELTPPTFVLRMMLKEGSFKKKKWFKKQNSSLRKATLNLEVKWERHYCVITCFPSVVSNPRSCSSQSASRGRPSSQSSPFTLLTRAPFHLQQQVQKCYYIARVK